MKLSPLTALAFVCSHTLLGEAFFYSQTIAAFVVRGSSRQLQTSMNADGTNRGFSFVEGSDFFENEEEEVIAMGGDPFFINSEQEMQLAVLFDADKPIQVVTEHAQKTTSSGFVWDGQEEEDAYFDE
jgi:hypothetical protein